MRLVVSGSLREFPSAESRLSLPVPMLTVLATAVLAAPAPAVSVALTPPPAVLRSDDFSDAVGEGRSALISGDLIRARRAFEV